MQLRRLAAVLCFWLVAQSALAADVGFFIRNGTTSITNPVAGKTVLLDLSDNTIKVWTGSVWSTSAAPKSSLTETTDPAGTNDTSQGYSSGSVWKNTTSGSVFVCTNAARNAAQWHRYIALPASKIISGLQTITPGTSASIKHGLDHVPTVLLYAIQSATSEFGYSSTTPDIIFMPGPAAGVTGAPVSIRADGTNIYLEWNKYTATGLFAIVRKDTGSSKYATAPITNANWRFIIYAW